MRAALACFALLAACASTPSLLYVTESDAGPDAASPPAPDASTPEARAPEEASAPDVVVVPDAATEAGAPDADAGSDGALGPFCPPVPPWATKCEGTVPCIGPGKDCDDRHDDCQKCVICCIVKGEATCVTSPSSCPP